MAVASVEKWVVEMDVEKVEKLEFEKVFSMVERSGTVLAASLVETWVAQRAAGWVAQLDRTMAERMVGLRVARLDSCWVHTMA